MSPHLAAAGSWRCVSQMPWVFQKTCRRRCQQASGPGSEVARLPKRATLHYVVHQSTRKSPGGSGDYVEGLEFFLGAFGLSLWLCVRSCSIYHPNAKAEGWGFGGWEEKGRGGGWVLLCLEGNEGKGEGAWDVVHGTGREGGSGWVVGRIGGGGDGVEVG